MKTSDFFFELPSNLIAQHPPSCRGQSRLMVMNRKTHLLEHKTVNDLPSVLEKGTLMVFNNSRVRKARLFGVSEETGAKAEFLLLKKLDAFSWQAISNRSGRKKTGSRYFFNDVKGEIASNAENSLLLRFDRPVDDAWLDINGHVPLPPYIKREDSSADSGRYQTIFAGEYGSAAAPTAGLHFTEELLKELEKAGIETAFITLHVGLGTFLPVRTENVEDHKMHDETYCINEKTAFLIEKARAEGRKILAVGTTSCRSLESAWIEKPPDPAENKSNERVRRGGGNTSIFIYPGYEFKAVDALFTNFHTPGSTLLMLVSAFAGREFIMESYKEAIREGYRFFSYGDACLIL